MPFGPIPSNKKLGIANGNMPDSAGFANYVLRLAGLIPVYQGQLVRSVNWAPPGNFANGSGDAVWCAPADISYSQTGYIREISGNDTYYARRCLRDAQTPANALLDTPQGQGHASQTSNQVYYFGNEPETYSPNIGSNNGCSGWGARDNIIDSFLSGIFPNNPIPNLAFWEPDGPVNPKYHTKADALAYSFLKVRKELVQTAPYASRNHTVLPPCAINIADLGLRSNNQYSPPGQYWNTFYTWVKSGFLIGLPNLPAYINNMNTQVGVTALEDLKVLHAHYYDQELKNWPLAATLPADLPARSVAKLAVAARHATNWLRGIYGLALTADIPIDIYLSESGPNWLIQDPGRDPVAALRLPCYWAGGWPNFQMGLSWWNTWLCWMTRRAAYDCKLQGWNTGAHTLHAGVHEPMQPPYVAPTLDGPGWSFGNSRNQVYFNCDNAMWSPGQVNSAETINVPGLAEVGRFKRSFSCFPDTAWDYLGLPYKFWRSGPFAACLKVWSEVGNDPDPASFGSGWYTNTASGIVGTYSITIPAGYSTIYFPLMKSTLGTFSPSPTINFTWLKQDANGNVIGSTNHGCMLASEMTDSQTYTGFNPWNTTTSYNQDIYSSMIFPAVCYSSTPKTIKIRLDRNLAGPQLRFGRPIVLPFACSWFYDQ